MADKSGLEFLGFLFGGVTLAVTLIAFMVVRDHVQGRLQLDDVAMAPQLVSMSNTPVSRIRSSLDLAAHSGRTSDSKGY